jgi:hypothetical protein
MKKENIGALVILSGVAILGYFWFKKNKPKLSKELKQKMILWLI